MKEVLKLGSMLLIICVIAAILLGMTYEFTIDQITAQRQAINEQARKEVLGDADEFKPVDEDILKQITDNNDVIQEVFAGYKNGNIIGYAIKATPQGYGGPVEVITGIDVDGNISGVRVGNHTETPGLGASATNPEFYSQYDNKTASMDLKVVKANPNEDEIQALSGATITSVAVTDGVNYSIEAFKIINNK